LQPLFAGLAKKQTRRHCSADAGLSHNIFFAPRLHFSVHKRKASIDQHTGHPSPGSANPWSDRASGIVLRIGPYTLDANVILAPMAGVTDQPFRNLCRNLGAGMAVSEMLSADVRLWNTEKSRRRLDHRGESSPRSVQIAGGEPEMMAVAARECVHHGAQVVDINMGCPAKKVCKRAAGSALLKDERLVRDILAAVISAVDVPVTLKIRTGWDSDNRNAVSIARLAEDAGIAALTVHGRTRACKFVGDVEYDTIAEVKSAVKIPVIANGDIDSGQKALDVIEYTKADGVMIGRAAQGNPWIFREVIHFLTNQAQLPQPLLQEQKATMLAHIRALHEFYGEYLGVRIARKHAGWYLAQFHAASAFLPMLNRIECATSQLQQLETFFENLNLEEGLAA
jgi:tRNA-dihydrouridine synthase B